MDETMRQLLCAREDMYHFLSRLYMFEVDKAFFDSLKAMEFPENCANEDMAKGYGLISGWLLEHEGSEEDLDVLAVDYARVFLSAGVAAGSAAFPYESVYANKKHLVMQEAASQMSTLYAQKGMEIDKNMFRVPADHVGLEFEYMARLCCEAGDGAGEPEVPLAQIDFFKKHLNNWVPVFGGEVIKYSETAFYKGLGWLTRGFMALEAQILGSFAQA